MRVGLRACVGLYIRGCLDNAIVFGKQVGSSQNSCQSAEL